MLVYFNSMGQIQRQLEYGSLAYLSSTNFYIFSYQEGYTYQDGDTATLNLKKPDGTLLNISGIYGTWTSLTFNKPDSVLPENCTPFVDGTTYAGFKFLIDDVSVLDQTGMWKGTVVINPTAEDTSSRTLSGVITIYVNESEVNISGVEMTYSEYTTIINRMLALETLIQNHDNIENDAEEGSLKQIDNYSEFTFDNPNSGVSGTLAVGAFGAYSAEFGGKSRVEGSRSFVSGTCVYVTGGKSAGFGNQVYVPGANAFGTGLQTVASGTSSFATGDNTQATATSAFASGWNTKSSGMYSFTANSGNEASGTSSFSSGSDNTSGGYVTDVGGAKNKVVSDVGFARGYSNYVGTATSGSSSGSSSGAGTTDAVGGYTVQDNSGFASAVFGIANSVYANYSFCVGFKNTLTSGNGMFVSGNSNNVAGNYVTVCGESNNANSSANYVTVFGRSNTVTGDATCSYTEGENNTNDAYCGHIQGAWSTVSGSHGFSTGLSNVVSGARGNALGYALVVGYDNQTAVGYFNENHSDTLFEVGGGSASGRKNVFEVLKDGTIRIANFSSASATTPSGYVHLKLVNGVFTIV